MFKRIDRSKTLIRLLENLSTFLARQRGFPIILGIILIFGGTLLELLNVFTQAPLIEVAHIVFHNFGIITALVGILLLIPIGE